MATHSSSFAFLFPSSCAIVNGQSLISELTGTILMRIRIGAHVLLLMLAVIGSSVRAEPPQWIIPINSSFRVGYLYGSQVVSTSTDSFGDPGDPVQLDISFGSPVLSGTIELSPFPLSGPWPTYSLMLSYVEIDPTTGQKWTEAGR
jgi:hypothetical protein